VTDTDFLTLLRQSRAGNEQAAAELMSRYGKHVQRVARSYVDGTPLQRVLDSSDICQSVMANFFLRMVAGQFELETPEQLLKLLATMARNHALKKLEYYKARKRDVRRDATGEDAERDWAAAGGSPSAVVADAELVRHIRDRLSEEEWLLLQERAAGRAWNEIAQELGTSPERIRKRLDRAIQRVADSFDATGRQ
jgi:RNA polymerase sigma factor (sigma-70 family)